jgi:hypothetical protein
MTLTEDETKLAIAAIRWTLDISTKLELLHSNDALNPSLREPLGVIAQKLQETLPPPSANGDEPNRAERRRGKVKAVADPA